MSLPEPDSELQNEIVVPARLCGYVGQTVLIYRRKDGTLYCNYKENNGCDEAIQECRLRKAREMVF